MADQRTNLLLVQEVEKRPILYNYLLPGYSRKDETEKAWNEVANIVKLTAAECKNRWKNIRSVFIRHMKLIMSGSGATDKKAYYLLEAMQFTVPFIKSLREGNFGNMSQHQEQEEGEELERDGSTIGDYLLLETTTPSPSSVLPPRPPSSSSSSTQDVQAEPIKHTPKKKRVENNETQKQSSSDAREEPLKMFLLSMLPDLLKMDDWEVRQFKRKTLDNIDEILSAKSTQCQSTSSATYPDVVSPSTKENNVRNAY